MIDRISHALSEQLLALGGDGYIGACLFDMDGVMLDSMPSHATSWVRAVRTAGIVESKSYFYACEGQTGRETIIKLFQKHRQRLPTEEEIERLYTLKCVYFDELDEHKTMGYAPELIRFLAQESEVVRVLVTGSGHPSLLSRLQSNFGQYWTAENIVSARDVEHGKPHPEPYLKAIDKAGVAACRCLVIENAPMGILSACSAGLTVLGINTGPLSDRELLKAGATAVVQDLRTVHQVIATLIRHS